jgi:hypothetical protein
VVFSLLFTTEEDRAVMKEEVMSLVTAWCSFPLSYWPGVKDIDRRDRR